MDTGDDEHLRRDAAAWFARMRGPGAETSRAEFDAWRATPANQRAYDRMIQRFDDSAILAHSRVSNLRLSPTANRRAPPALVWWGAVAAAVVLTTALALSRPARSAFDTEPGATRSFASRAGEIRTVSLAPGVIAVLDADSAVTTATREGRVVAVRLDRGRARIQAAGPVDAEAAGARLHADGGVFDLELTAERGLQMAALRGTVNVARKDALIPARALRLAAGQSLILADGRPGRPMPAPARDRDWPTGLLIFDETPLDQVVTLANRYGWRKIHLSDPSLARLRVTGGLKVTDPDGLARALAAALGLNAARAPGGDIVLSRNAA
jgi:transmembrane sensor